MKNFRAIVTNQLSKELSTSVIPVSTGLVVGQYNGKESRKNASGTTDETHLRNT
jgi:hypothetical protein